MSDMTPEADLAPGTTTQYAAPADPGYWPRKLDLLPQRACADSVPGMPGAPRSTAMQQEALRGAAPIGLVTADEQREQTREQLEAIEAQMSGQRGAREDGFEHQPCLTLEGVGGPMREYVGHARSGAGPTTGVVQYVAAQGSVIVFNRCFGLRLPMEHMGPMDVLSFFVTQPSTPEETDRVFPDGALQFLRGFVPARDAPDAGEEPDASDELVDGMDASDELVDGMDTSDDAVSLPAVFRKLPVNLIDVRSLELLRAGGAMFMWRTLFYEGDATTPPGIVGMEGWPMRVQKIGGKTKKAMNKKKHKNKLVDETDPARRLEAIKRVTDALARLSARAT